MTSTARLLRDHRAMAGLGILGVLVVAGLFAPLLAPADPVAQADVLTTRFLPPLATGPDGVLHWLGTDGFGRDLLSRMLYGARISLFVGILSVAISIMLGGAVGFAAGLVGGRVERLLMAVTDAVLAMPRLILLLALVTLWQSSILLIVLVLGFTGWMSVARLARAEVKGLLARPFVEAARAAGAGRWHVLTRHLMPNSLTPVIVAAALAVGNAIMLEAGLSFLGLGIPAPSPSWGNMIAEGRQALVNAPWIATFPGIAVVLAVIGCNLLGDGVRDVLDPTVLSHRQRIKRTATPPTRAD